MSFTATPDRTPPRCRAGTPENIWSLSGIAQYEGGEETLSWKEGTNGESNLWL